MKRIHIIVKVTDGCNLRCKYCYNSESQYSGKILPLKRFEKLLRLLSAFFDGIDLVWHGGEPMSAGLEYYRKAVEIEEKVFLETNTEITNSIQTNGTLIDKEWVAFFKKYRFMPGISFDGLNNSAYRQKTDDVLKNMELMKKGGVHFGCMSVVADETYDMLENYKFFKELGVSVAFSPMFSEGGGKKLSGVSAERYVSENIRLFDHWITDKTGVSVKDFNSYVSMIMGAKARVCCHGSCLGKWLGVNADGELCNCGRDAIKQFPYGNIDDMTDINEAYRSEGFKKLLIGSIERRKKCKQECEYFDFCEGGCPDMALIENGLENIPGFSCQVFKGVFGHVKKKMEEIFANNTPLDELNPAVKAIALKCLSQFQE